MQKVLRHGPSIVHDFERLKGHFGDSGTDFHIFVVNFMLPWGNFVGYFLRPHIAVLQKSSADHPTEGSEDLESAKRVLRLYDRFSSADEEDEYRDLRLKMTPRVVEGPWLVRKAVGKGNKAAKLAEHIELSYYREIIGDDDGSNDGNGGQGGGRSASCGRYFEVEINVSNSAVGNSILSVVTGYISSVSIDLGMTIEGVNQGELPERVLGALRFHNLDIGSAPFMPSFLEAEGEEGEGEEEGR